MKNRSAVPVISPTSLGALLLVTLLGLDFLDTPHDSVKWGGPSGYWIPLVAFGYALIWMGLILLFQRRFPRQDIFAASRNVLGRPLAFLGNGVFILAFLIWAVFAARDSVDVIRAYLLNRTPQWALAAFCAFATGYIALNGIDAVVRLAGFFAIPPAAFRLIMQLLSFQGMSASHLLPVFSASPARYLIGGMALFNVFMPLGTVLILHPYLERPARLGRSLLWPALLALMVFLSAVAGTIAVFGTEYTLKFVSSNLAAVSHVNIPYLVIEQLGLVFLVTWAVLFLLAMSHYACLISMGFQALFRRVRYDRTVVMLVILVWGVGLAFPSAFMAHSLFRVVRRWAVLPVFAYPLTVYAISLIRGVRGDRL